jgi:hypothetical protein
MGLDPKVRQSLAAVTGESVATCFGRDLRAVLAALDEAEARAEKAERELDAWRGPDPTDPSLVWIATTEGMRRNAIYTPHDRKAAGLDEP